MSEVDVFVSYSRPDRSQATAIARWLTKLGFAVWIDQTGIEGGASYGGEIVRAIRQARAMLVVCSRSSLRSKNVQSEISLCWDQGAGRYVPVWVEPPTTYPENVAYWLSSSQWIDGSSGIGESAIASEAWFDRVLSALDASGIRPSRRRSTSSDQRKEFTEDRATPANDGSAAEPSAAASDSMRFDLERISSGADAARAARRVCEQLGFLPLAQTVGHRETLNGSVPLERVFRVVPPGRYRVGGRPDDEWARADERPSVEVTIERPYFVRHGPVTAAECLDAFSRLGRPRRAGRSRPDGEAHRRAATDYRYDEVRSLLPIFSEQYGCEVRLPSEVEWEIAARAGQPTRYWWGEEFVAHHVRFNCDAPELPASLEEAKPRENPFGLADMLGCIEEWTSSAYGPLTDAEAILGSPNAETRHRVIRGGSYRDDDARVLTAFRRTRFPAGGQSRTLGFRLVVDFDALSRVSEKTGREPVILPPDLDPSATEAV